VQQQSVLAGTRANIAEKKGIDSLLLAGQVVRPASSNDALFGTPR
jgi:hypothetical protein